jgi:hypothetical protein
MDTISPESVIQHLQRKIENCDKTKNGNSYGDYRMEVNIKFSNDGEYEGTQIRLIKKDK